MTVRLSGIREFRLLWISGLLAALGAQMSLLALLITMLPDGALADAAERLRLLRLCTAAR